MEMYYDNVEPVFVGDKLNCYIKIDKILFFTSFSEPVLVKRSQDYDGKYPRQK